MIAMHFTTDLSLSENGSSGFHVAQRSGPLRGAEKNTPTPQHDARRLGRVQSEHPPDSRQKHAGMTDFSMGARFLKQTAGKSNPLRIE